MKTSPAIQSELWTLEEVAAFLRVKHDWIYQKISAGKLPFNYTKVGHLLRFKADVIRRYVENQTRGGDAA